VILRRPEQVGWPKARGPAQGRKGGGKAPIVIEPSFGANHCLSDESAEAPLRASRSLSDACVARRVRSCPGGVSVTIQGQSHVRLGIVGDAQI
jgi:hypothetical protein